jgi:hypothetical protein
MYMPYALNIAASTPSIALLKPFLFLHIGPMSDVTMLGRLCVADCWHTMVCSALQLAKKV